MSLHDPFRRKVGAAIASLPLIACGANREIQASYTSNSYFLRDTTSTIPAGGSSI